MSRRTGHEGIPLCGILLVGVGLLLLLQTTGVVSWNAWANLWRFWPVLLIAAGVNVLMGRRLPLLAGLVTAALVFGAFAAAAVMAAPASSEGTSTFTEELGNLDRVDVDIDFGAGELRLSPLPASSTMLVDASFTGSGGARASLERQGQTGRLHFDTTSRRFFLGERTQRWDIALSRTPELTLNVGGGAAKWRLDLADLRVTRLDIDLGASAVALTLPMTGDVDATIDAGAASINVVVPEGVAARIRPALSGMASVNVDEGRFPETRGMWESPNYDTAANRVDLTLKVGAASVTVR